MNSYSADASVRPRFVASRCVVTGGASGIGLAIARRFLEEGAEVVIWDVRPAAVDEAVSSLREVSESAHGVVVDIADSTSVSEAADETLQILDGGVTILVNNAGVLDDYKPILETSEELWDRTLGVNLKGMFLTTKALLPSMLAAGGGAIVNTASVSAIIAGGGGPAYTSSKHGVVGFTKQMASDYASQGVRVNAIAPGAVATGMTKDILDNEELEVVQALRASPAGRHAEPDELASVALFLASDEAQFVHGAVFVADGGWTIR
jgi:3-oxoacyl-[acyl-carrier protein] reductase